MWNDRLAKATVMLSYDHGVHYSLKEKAEQGGTCMTSSYANPWLK